MNLKKIFLMCSLTVWLFVPKLYALPIGLNTFDKDIGVTILEEDSVIFEEQELEGWIGLYKDPFLVPSNAVSLSFDYVLDVGSDDDFLSFYLEDEFFNPIVDAEFPAIQGGALSGSFSASLVSYQGTNVYIEWALNSDFQNDYFSSAQLENIDIDCVPVPEPSTLTLIAIGFFGILPFRKKLFYKHFS